MTTSLFDYIAPHLGIKPLVPPVIIADIKPDPKAIKTIVCAKCGKTIAADKAEDHALTCEGEGQQ